jgi:hypothetical protein
LNFDFWHSTAPTCWAKLRLRNQKALDEITAWVEIGDQKTDQADAFIYHILVAPLETVMLATCNTI